MASSDLVVESLLSMNEEELEVLENWTIPELFKFLKMTFVDRHFDRVQKLLLEREERSKHKVEQLSQKLQLERLENIKLAHKLKILEQRSGRSANAENQEIKKEKSGNDNYVDLESHTPQDCVIVEKEQKFHHPCKNRGSVKSPSVELIDLSDCGDDFARARVLNKHKMAYQKCKNDQHLVQENAVKETTGLKRGRELCADTVKHGADGEDDTDSSQACRQKMQVRSCRSATKFSDGCQSAIPKPCGDKLGMKVSAPTNPTEDDGRVSDDDSSGTSCSEDDISKEGGNAHWKNVTEMLLDFQNTPELCMEAICALYRQHMSLKVSLEDSSSSKTRGFSESDEHRGINLAKFLTDGDQQRKLNKSKLQLCMHDHKGLDDCKGIALRHSQQLFEIYEKKQDPFFRPS